MTAGPVRAGLVEAAVRLLEALAQDERAEVWGRVCGPLRCSVLGCPNASEKYRDLCSGHRGRLRSRGDVLADVPLRPYRRRQPAADTKRQAAA